nr:MAG TPA: hypothetical protein [Caudoviricetes sp.]
MRSVVVNNYAFPTNINLFHFPYSPIFRGTCCPPYRAFIISDFPYFVKSFFRKNLKFLANLSRVHLVELAAFVADVPAIRLPAPVVLLAVGVHLAFNGVGHVQIPGFTFAICAGVSADFFAKVGLCRPGEHWGNPRVAVPAVVKAFVCLDGLHFHFLLFFGDLLSPLTCFYYSRNFRFCQDLFLKFPHLLRKKNLPGDWPPGASHQSHAFPSQ